MKRRTLIHATALLVMAPAALAAQPARAWNFRVYLASGSRSNRRSRADAACDINLHEG